jgi:hypothetical protein
MLLGFGIGNSVFSVFRSVSRYFDFGRSLMFIINGFGIYCIINISFRSFKFQEDVTNELGDARVDKHEENRRKKKQVNFFSLNSVDFNFDWCNCWYGWCNCTILIANKFQVTTSIIIFIGDRRKLQASLSWRVRSNDQHVAADQQEVQRCNHQAGKRNRGMTSIWIFRFLFRWIIKCSWENLFSSTFLHFKFISTTKLFFLSSDVTWRPSLLIQSQLLASASST